MKKALIFGVSGQAGSYLVELLLNKGYEIYGTYNKGVPYIPITHKTLGKYFTLRCDITNPINISNVIRSCEPDEIYNMTSMLYAPKSWDNPVKYTMTNGVSVVDMLQVYYTLNPKGKFFQAGSADVFDRIYPQNEHTPIRPRSPYGIAKAMAQESVRIYREEKDFFACTGIFFNMESPRRNTFFFTRKCVSGIVNIHLGRSSKLKFGSLAAQRDWGLAPEYVEAAYLMLQAKTPSDYVIGTGEVHTCEEFVQQVCKQVGVDFINVEYDKSVPVDIDKSISDPSKIKAELNWEAKSKFLGVVKYLVDQELKSASGIDLKEFK